MVEGRGLSKDLGVSWVIDKREGVTLGKLAEGRGSYGDIAGWQS